MSCQLGQELLQRHLDEGGPADALERHVAGCPDCAADWPAVGRLLAGVRLLKPPSPPDGLRETIVGSLLAEARLAARSRWRRRVVSLGGLAAAAAVAITLGVWAWRPAAEDRPLLGSAQVRPVPAPAAPAQEPLRESMEQVGSAVAALTSRTASETVDRTTLIVPLVRQTAPPLADVPAALEPPLEPYREATQGVSAGLAPVADSARRAVGLFLRDLPMGR
jgi:hypothetical protein